MDGMNDVEEGRNEESGWNWSDTFWWSVQRNESLQKKLHEGAFGILNASRTILLGTPGPSSSSSTALAEPSSQHSRLLDLPLEILRMVLGFVFPSPLSDRQIPSILRHAADRSTLLSRMVEPELLAQRLLRWRARPYLGRHRRPPFQ